MEGIEILNRTMVTELTVSGVVLGLIGIAMSIFIIIMVSDDDVWDGDWLPRIGCFVLFVILFIASIVKLTTQKPTGRYQYEAIIDESVSMTDVHEKYKVIGQEGKIWILEDKEN